MKHRILATTHTSEGVDPAPHCEGELTFGEYEYMVEGMPYRHATCGGCGHSFRVSIVRGKKSLRRYRMITQAGAVKVFVVTHETQGQRSNDFCHAQDGELATFGSMCDGATADDRCGCARAMSGAVSLLATTTVRVVMWPAGRDDVAARIRASLQAGGWLSLCDDAAADAWVVEDTDTVLKAAAAFTPGQIVEIRGDRLQSRHRDDGMRALDREP
jgi:hypothetical protein